MLSNAFAFQDEVPITVVIPELNTIGERVAWARKQRRLTQEQLASRAGVAQSTIGSLESGQRQRPRELVSLAKALDASINWLETGEGDWEADPREAASIYEQLLPELLQPELLQGSVVSVQRLSPAEKDDLPEWVRMFSPRYVPDFALRLPGADQPVYVEVKGVRAGSRADPFMQLAASHPAEYAVWIVDPSKPRLGLDDFLDDLRHKVLMVPGNHDTYRGPEWGAWGGPPEEIRTREEQTAYRVARKLTGHALRPILAWEHPDDLPDGDFVMIPRLDVHPSTAGGPDQVEIQLVKDDPQAFRSEWIRSMKLKPSKLAAMRASGESMEPTIHDGDSLLVDTSDTRVVDGKVYALWYDGGERVKRLFRLPGGGLRIESDNKRFPTLEVSAADTPHVRVIGRVVHRSGVGGL